MNLRSLILAVPLAAVAACGGGSSSTGAGTAKLTAATPSFAKISFDQTTADRSPPAPVAAPLAAPTAGDPSAMMGPGGSCHPHLFVREREVVERVNRHIYKALGKVEGLISTVEFSDTTKSYTWTKSENGTDSSFTINLIAPNEYSWELDAARTGDSLAPVMTGMINRDGATGAHDGNGKLSIDFAKLHAAYPNERVSSGTLDVEFNVSEASRTISVVANQVTWELDPSHFDGGVIPTGLEQPRSGAYVYHREPGKGGSLKIQDEMVFACGMDPSVTNPSLVPASSQLVSRWYKTTDGSVHGRSDGLITGGPLTGAVVDSIVGVTCRSATPSADGDQHMPMEGFWLMKAEKGGVTVVGLSSTSVNDTTSSTPCDPAYGDVPNLNDNKKDFAGWPDSYTDGKPYDFLPQ